jgi:hypothetical protein
MGGLFVAALLVIAAPAIAMGVQAGATTVNPGTLTCSPASPSRGGGCQLVFTDLHPRTGYGATPARGHMVCFSTAAPNAVYSLSGTCTGTNYAGKAYGVFAARALGTVQAKACEAYHGVQEGCKQVTITVTR